MRQAVDMKAKAHIFSNIWFMLKCAYKAAPGSMFVVHTAYLIESVYYSIVFGIMFLETALSIIEGGGSFREFVIKIGIMSIGKLLVDFYSYYAWQISRAKLEIKTESYINAMIFKKAQEVDLACYEDPDFFDNYNRATWVVEKGGFKRIIEGLGWTMGSVVSIVILAIYLCDIDPFLLLFMLCPIIVIAIGIKRNSVDFEKEKVMTPFERQKDYTRRTVLLKDFAKEIKTTGIFSVVKRRFNSAIENNLKVIQKYGLKIALIEMLSDFFGSVLPLAGGFTYGCYRLVVAQDLQISQFSVLISAIRTCQRQLGQLARYFTMQQKHCLWVQNLREFLAYEPKVKAGSIEPGEFESLEFKNVSFNYGKGKADTLKNVSFKINKGERIAVVGHNGAGKTTLSKLMMRLYDVTQGEILYNGVNIKEYDLIKYREKFASVFQDYMIFAMTVAENVLVQEADESNINLAEKSLRQSGVMNKIETLPNGMNSILTREFDEKGVLLSGGEAQKVTIARMFAKKFDIAILDEPSSALDPVAEAAMYENLMEGTKNKTVIYISHRLSSATASDNILVFAGGELVEQGNHSQLMAHGGEYCNMFTLQAAGYREEDDKNEE